VPVSTGGAPSPRQNAAVAWSGKAVFVWGGDNGLSDLADGGLYDPKTDVWKAVGPAAGAPSPRVLAAAVATGASIVVWGGGPSSGAAALGDGRRYDLATGTWAALSEVQAPAGRRSPVAVWTGSRVLVWGGVAGGSPVAGGGLYDPASDTWTAVSSSGAPSARSGVAAAWSGKELYLFGGRPGGAGETDAGFAYDPQKDEWRSLPAAGAPSPRFDAFAVWVKGMLLVWGGESSGGALDDGARYDPISDAWAPVGSSNALSKRSQRAGWSGWTGATAARGVLFGGVDGTNVKTDGRLFDPIAGAWEVTGSAAKKYQGGAGVWTGAELVLWSGRDGATLLASGQRYKP
jgi:N-acetylneuraminic acid mutarotase